MKSSNSKLKGKCQSCGVNFSDHMSLVGTCVEFQKFLNPSRRFFKLYTEFALRNDELVEALNKFKPIRCKDRMPSKEDLPVIAYDVQFKNWYHAGDVNEKQYSHWMPMPKRPE